MKVKEIKINHETYFKVNECTDNDNEFTFIEIYETKNFTYLMLGQDLGDDHKNYFHTVAFITREYSMDELNELIDVGYPLEMTKLDINNVFRVVQNSINNCRR